MHGGSVGGYHRAGRWSDMRLTGLTKQVFTQDCRVKSLTSRCGKIRMAPLKIEDERDGICMLAYITSNLRLLACHDRQSDPVTSKYHRSFAMRLHRSVHESIG